MSACRPYALLVLLLVTITPAQGQLISPGKLSRSHTSLEGIRNCTQCHELRTRGISRSKCLACHTPLATRIRSRQGYHARIREQDCAECHKDHFGLDFKMVRFDTTRFKHADAGFLLKGAHTGASCRDCHTPQYIMATDVRSWAGQYGTLRRTWLGVATTCNTCHRNDNPHGMQFSGQSCNTCHTETQWSPSSGFDHARTHFPLTGLHRNVRCASCHPGSGKSLKFQGIAHGTCTSCHKDVHSGAMGARCETCHATTGWSNIRSGALDRGFDHARTGFELRGSHATAPCTSCHAKPPARTDRIRITYVQGTATSAYPHPRAATCTDCHVDLHQGSIANSTCTGCHDERTWKPALYDVPRHNREATFKLTGAHETTPCASCHTTLTRYRFSRTDCQSCHEDDSPHGDQLSRTCENCHETGNWNEITGFSHDRTHFPLTGAHAKVTCQSCHAPEGGASQYRGLDLACASCHHDNDPHARQFDNRACDTCHETSAWTIAAFDHQKTRFPLEDAHASVACALCHKSDEIEGVLAVRYRPIDTACKNCH